MSREDYEKLQREYEIWKLRAEVAEKRAEEETTKYSIALHGIPQLGYHTFSTDSKNSKSANAQVKKVEEVADTGYSLSEVQFLKKNGSLLTKTRLTVSCEGDVEEYVKDLYGDLLSAMGISDFVYIEKHATFAKAGTDGVQEAGQVPDMLMLREAGGRPLLPTEVKLPPRHEKSTGLDESQSEFIYQIYKQMVDMRNNFGVREVFGVITTYNGFRIVWFEDADWLAKKYVSIEDVCGTKDQRQEFHEKMELEWKNVIASSSLNNNSNNNSNIKLYATRVYNIHTDGRGENCLVLRVLASFILKGLAAGKLASFREYNDVIGKTLDATIHIKACQSASSLQWVLPTDRKSIISRGYPSKFSGFQSDITLLRHLGVGHDGSAWLVAALNQNVMHCFVLKRFKGIEAAKYEAKCWNLVYPNMYCYKDVIERSGSHSIMIPYFRPISEQEEKSADVLEKLFVCLRDNFWSKCIAHNDIRWCNIGWETNGGEKSIVVYDLAMCTFENSREEAIQKDKKSENSVCLIEALQPHFQKELQQQQKQKRLK